MARILKLFNRGIAVVFIFLVQVYRWTLSPLKRALLGPASGCRFSPSCSRYAIDCFKQLPVHKALWYGAWRILRCNPWGGSGYDPAPGTIAGAENFVANDDPVTSLRDIVK